MANVIIIPPSTQVQTVAATGGGQAQNAATSNLSPGQVLSGVITGRDASGNFLLRTGQGTLSLQSSTPLTYNSDVVIQVGGGNAAVATTARIISVNGEPYASFSAPEPETSDSVSSSAQQAQATAPLPPVSDNITPTAIRGVILSAPTAEQALSNTQAGNDNSQPVSGTPVVIHVTTAPETTTQQAATSSGAQPAAQQQAGTQPASSSVEAQVQVQQLAEDTTPANVAKLVAPQPGNIQQQNAPAPTVPANAPAATPATTTTTTNTTTTTQPQSPEEELAAASPSAQPPTPAPAQTIASNVLYATYSKNTAPTASAPSTSAATPASTTAASNTTTTLTGSTTTAQTATASSTTAATAASSQPATPATSTLPAQVASSNANAGTVTLQTPVGNVVIKADATPGAALALPAAGTSVSIELPSNSVLLTALIQTPLSQALLSTPAPLSELASSWQTLSDIVNVVSANNAPAATQLLSHLPQAGTDFITSTASFISAIATGDARKLLGDDAVDTLRQTGRLDLLQKFTAEMSGLNDAFNANSPALRDTSGWQPLFLPFVYQEELQQARLYVKREPPKKGRDNNRSTQDTRFVVEIDMSELGPMQMDGLVRSRQETMAFDLIIRSRMAFSADDQAQINEIYNNASELTGFKGTLAFQVTHDFPVKPLDEILAATPRSIMA